MSAVQQAPKQRVKEVIVVNAEGQILGRMSSQIVKLMKQVIKEGKEVEVHIVNSEKAVVSGPWNRVINGYKLLFTVRTLWNPEKQGIRRPRNPARIVKRTIRGMLPKNATGRIMYKSIKAYVGYPEEIKAMVEKGQARLVKFKEADVSRLRGKYVTVLEIAKAMGWKGA
ncbi:MAG: 50S ribosomal protein L13 [Sulfolobales archaeon]|nr:50S ribosomal protein L13 [Sulfolobales archaeon]MCG2893309.1 50S ribosomal protein L13 [Sulfolobales archaeon]